MEPPGKTTLLRSRGDCAVGLVLPPGEFDRLSALMSFTAVGGQPYQLELTLGDVVQVIEGLVGLLTADADRAAGWWYSLRGPRPASVADMAEVAR